jgi:hypothetical protein
LLLCPWNKLVPSNFDRFIFGEWHRMTTRLYMRTAEQMEKASSGGLAWGYEDIEAIYHTAVRECGSAPVPNIYMAEVSSSPRPPTFSKGIFSQFELTMYFRLTSCGKLMLPSDFNRDELMGTSTAHKKWKRLQRIKLAMQCKKNTRKRIPATYID